MKRTTMPFAQLRLGDHSFANPRTSSGLDDESLLELAVSIARTGLLVPLIVRPDGVIVSGQRRYRAITMIIEDPVIVTEAMIASGDARMDAQFAMRDAIDTMRTSVPVAVVEVDALDAEGIALADNLLRVDMSSYEIAARLAQLSQQGATGAALARAIGKSKTYVSRKLSTWSGACAELKRVWELGALPEVDIIEIAQLPPDDQRRSLALGQSPRGKRGPANRPGIDTVKDCLRDLEARVVPQRQQHNSPRYEDGVLDALRWVSGENASTSFVQLVNQAEEG